MSKAERIKEEIGWLKVVFAAAVALDAPLIAWLAQNYDKPLTVLIAGLAASAVLGVIVIYVNRLAYRRLNELENA